MSEMDGPPDAQVRECETSRMGLKPRATSSAVRQLSIPGRNDENLRTSQFGCLRPQASILHIMSRASSSQRNLTLTEELEKLEQTITLTLQGLLYST